MLLPLARGPAYKGVARGKDLMIVDFDDVLSALLSDGSFAAIISQCDFTRTKGFALVDRDIAYELEDVIGSCG